MKAFVIVTSIILIFIALLILANQNHLDDDE